MGTPQSQSGPQLRRDDNTLHLHLTKTGPRTEAHKAAKEQNEADVAAERTRLWYVTCTRAKQLLLLPRLDAPLDDAAWINMIDLGLDAIEGVDVTEWPAEVVERSPGGRNGQDAATFAAEAGRVFQAHRQIYRRTPSRHEADAADPADVVPVFSEEGAPAVTPTPNLVGSPARGLVLHKLLEEVLTGELDDAGMGSRADVLLRELGIESADDPSQGPCGAEIAQTAERVLALDDIAAIRDKLIPEAPVFSSTMGDQGEEIVSGLADAVAVDQTGAIEAVVDWKSDVAAEPKQRAQYREQMRSYLDALGCKAGLLVYATDGTVEHVGSE
jgi:exodeoxyribonuclease-5